jgi:2-isopropylmalate synthase
MTIRLTGGSVTLRPFALSEFDALWAEETLDRGPFDVAWSPTDERAKERLRERVEHSDHDDLGLAVANSVAAIQAGARQVECTINGIGERAGNCSLEEVVMILKTRADIFPYCTAIEAQHLYGASELLSSLITFGPQPNKAIVGRNAFAHEAGIHQDGYLKEKSTYEIIDPRSVGVPEGRLVLGKHSGRHALSQRCKDLGYDLTREELDALYHRFTAVADQRKKGLMDEEIIHLLHAGLKAEGAAAD